VFAAVAISSQCGRETELFEALGCLILAGKRLGAIGILLSESSIRKYWVGSKSWTSKFQGHSVEESVRAGGVL
jgi:hypothetical protein